MKQAVLLVSHGTVDALDDLPAFLKNVRHGRDAPAELAAELRKRYEAIGGSPLDAINVRLAGKLEKTLGVPVRRASRLWKPYVRDVLSELGELQRVVVIPLAQHSAHVYGAAAKRDVASMSGDRVEVACADNWGQRTDLLDAFARRARALAGKDAALVLTAHSLPTRVIAAGDAYEKETRAAARGVIDRVGAEYAETHVAFQSQGFGDGEWLGPGIPETLDALAGRMKRVVFAPIGFLADHVEILYDLDVEARALAEKRGLAYARTRSLDDADDFVAILADLAKDLLA
ncbi:MAG TPA: ferrochelatase [Polyangiaceae bacterium]|jgi:ferrochelatase